MDKFSFLLREASLLQELCESPESDLAIAKWASFKKFSSAERVALLEQRSLKKRSLKKISFGEKLLWTPIGLEQATRESVGRYKASKLSHVMGTFASAGTHTVVDLCCGMGGDSFFTAGKVIGIDRSWETLRVYKHNVHVARGEQSTEEFVHNVYGVLGDACQTPVGQSMGKDTVVLIDPARRPKKGDPHWGDRELSPSLDELEKIRKCFPNMVVKLGPGMELPEHLWSLAEVEFLGDRDECVEVALWFGELGVPGTVRVSEVLSGETLSAHTDLLEDSFSRVEEPGKYLYEPIKAVVRSHLFGVLAQQLGLWQIDEKTAYLSGNEEHRHSLVKGYRILGSCSLHTKHIQKLVDQYNIGNLEVKKRGVALLPEEVKKKLKLRGDESGVLILGRVSNKKVAFLTKPIR